MKMLNILEMVLDRAISTNFLIYGKNSLPTIFGSHLEFLCKMLKLIYLGNGVR